jgi:hypothetical protein
MSYTLTEAGRTTGPENLFLTLSCKIWCMKKNKFDLGYNEGVLVLSCSRCTIAQFDIKIKSQMERSTRTFTLKVSGSSS